MKLTNFIYRWPRQFQELYLERAAIMEYDAGLTREHAEKQAEKDIRWQANQDKEPVQEKLL